MQSHFQGLREKHTFFSRRLKVLPVKEAPTLELTTKLIFLHIPKTAGTILDFIGEDIYGELAKRIKTSFNPQISPNLMRPGYQGGLAVVKDDPTVCSSSLEYITGHMPFGLHNYLESPEQYQYVTLVRNPIERAISSVNFDCQRSYIRSDERHALECLLTSEIDNPQVRMIAGEDYMSGPWSQEIWDTALSNIDNHFMLVGLTDRAEDFFSTLAAMKQWGSLAICRAQVTNEKIITEQTLSQEIIQRLKEKHHYDLMLYEWVKNEYYPKHYTNELLSPKINEQFRCITPNFLTTRKSHLLTKAEIEERNSNIGPEEELITIYEKRMYTHST